MARRKQEPEPKPSLLDRLLGRNQERQVHVAKSYRGLVFAAAADEDLDLAQAEADLVASGRAPEVLDRDVAALRAALPLVELANSEAELAAREAQAEADLVALVEERQRVLAEMAPRVFAAELAYRAAQSQQLEATAARREIAELCDPERRRAVLQGADVVPDWLEPVTQREARLARESEEEQARRAQRAALGAYTTTKLAGVSR